MSCYICEGPVEKYDLDERDMKLLPCSTCLRIVHESVEEMEARDETDEFGLLTTSLPSDITDFHQELYSPEGRAHVIRYD